MRVLGLNRCQVVSKLLFFSFKITACCFSRRYFYRDPLYNLEAIPGQSDKLARIIGHDLKLGRPQVIENLCANALVALIGLKSKCLVGLDRVCATILEFVGFQLVDQANAAALLS